MGYLHINNLYKDQNVLLFKELYALEKIHGTSAHLKWTSNVAGSISYFSGGESHEKFKAIFNDTALVEAFKRLGVEDVTVYGEAYGGKCQKMAHTYGADLKFIAFDVSVGAIPKWYAVPEAERFVNDLGLRFVSYTKVPATIEALAAERDRPSEEAKRVVYEAKPREGVVLRPLVELSDVYGNRIIAKHKSEAFRETQTPRPVGDKLVVLEAAEKIANEWVTDERVRHVIDKMPLSGLGPQIELTGVFLNDLLHDVEREGAGEIAWSNEARRAVKAIAAKKYKEILTSWKS